MTSLQATVTTATQLLDAAVVSKCWTFARWFLNIKLQLLDLYISKRTQECLDISVETLESPSSRTSAHGWLHGNIMKTVLSRLLFEKPH